MVTFPKHFAAQGVVCGPTSLPSPGAVRIAESQAHFRLSQKLFLTRSRAGLDAVLLGGSVRSAVRFLKEFQPSVSDQGDLAGGLKFEAGSTSASGPGLPSFLQFLVLDKFCIC